MDDELMGAMNHSSSAWLLDVVVKSINLVDMYVPDWIWGDILSTVIDDLDKSWPLRSVMDTCCPAIGFSKCPLHPCGQAPCIHLQVHNQMTHVDEFKQSGWKHIEYPRQCGCSSDSVVVWLLNPHETSRDYLLCNMESPPFVSITRTKSTFKVPITVALLALSH